MVRIKHRFVLFRVTIPNDSDFKPEISDITKEIGKQLKLSYGDYGSGSIMPVLKTILWNQEHLLGVFRIPRDWSLRFQSFLPTITKIQDHPVSFHIPHISGTVDQLQRWLSRSDFSDIVF